VLEQYAIGYLIQDLSLSQTVHLTAYTGSTIFLTLALFSYALSNPTLGKNTSLPNIGEYAVGIYLVHFPLLYVLRGVARIFSLITGVDLTTTALWHLMLTPTVYVLSLGVYILLAKVNVIEIEGSHTPWFTRIRSQFGI